MRFVLLSVMLLLAGGCAQLQTKVPQDVEFDLSGRLAARYGKDAFTGNIAWRHAKSADEMLITSSLGAGVARIVREGDSVVLTTAEPREYRASDAEALTEEVLGFRLPLSGLADWVRGRPSDTAAAKADYDEQGRLRTGGGPSPGRTARLRACGAHRRALRPGVLHRQRPLAPCAQRR